MELLHIYLAAMLCLMPDMGQTEMSPEEKKSFKILANQLLSSELFIAEHIRSEGHSGLKQVRVNRIGTRNFHSATISDGRVAGSHCHANNIRTIGMGEFIAVLNGVEFRTRHNDYSLEQPSKTSQALHATEDIEFPPVPPAVLNAGGLQEQIDEMRLWFKAWADQDDSQRNYKDYFKPVLCYLEGKWVYPDKVGLDGFESDRHVIDAKDWIDLNNKVRFTSNAGQKSNLENLAFLPTTIVDFNGTVPVIAQWNYRILCHPLPRDLPLNRIRPVDDMKARMSRRLTYPEYIGPDTDLTRYQINIRDVDSYNDNLIKRSFLDELMEGIPGLNNYPASMHDEFDMLRYHMEKDENGNDVALNAGYYNRWYRVAEAGAMGGKDRIRSFSDDTLFMAMTDHPEVVPTTYTSCDEHDECTTTTQRWSYAIPLEIIYLTPLSSWNYYDIPYRGKAGRSGKVIYKNGRNGNTAETAYNGTNSKVYYLTPTDFFDGSGADADPADTTRATVWILNSAGEPVQVKASGHCMFLAPIEGVGRLRQRFPIMPVFGEGSAVWKELEAIKDILLEPNKFYHMKREAAVSVPSRVTGGSSSGGGAQAAADGAVAAQPVVTEPPIDPSTMYVLRLMKQQSDHYHEVYISVEDMEKIRQKQEVWVMTQPASTNGSHMHELKIDYKLQGKGDRQREYFDVAEITNDHFPGHRLRLQYQSEPSY